MNTKTNFESMVFLTIKTRRLTFSVYVWNKRFWRRNPSLFGAIWQTHGKSQRKVQLHYRYHHCQGKIFLLYIELELVVRSRLLKYLTFVYIPPSSLSLQADVNRKYRMHDKLERVHSGPFSNARNVFARVNVRPGRYVSIPSTFEPGCHGKFILRTYSSKGLNLRYDEIVRVLIYYDLIAKIENYKWILTDRHLFGWCYQNKLNMSCICKKLIYVYVYLNLSYQWLNCLKIS